MFINNLKIAFRNIFCHKVISVINVTGLAIGLAISILILIWIQDELSFDRFQKNYSSIYRIIGNNNTLTTPQPLAPVIREEIPEIVNAARISAFPIGQLEYDRTIYDERPVLADQSFFEIFSFPFIEGDPRSALESPGSMVISQQLAKKLFGDKQALGETVYLLLPGRKFEYTIAGIMKDMPSNSHIQANCIVSFLGFVKRLYGGDLRNWTDWSCVTYIQTNEKCNINELKQKITGSLLKHTDNNTDYVLQQLQPLKDIHLHPYRGEYGVSGDIKYIYIFSVVAFIIILIACINYVNLTTSASIRRIKEAGIKKAIGATRVSLIRQFTIESFIIVLIALNFAILLINLLLPLFDKLTGKVLEFSFTNISTILLIVAGIITIGICAGFFPAWYLSSINPREIMQSKTSLPRRKVISGQVLSIIQFTLSVAVIAGAIVINKQMGYIKNMYPGFNKNNLVYFHLMDNEIGNIQFLKSKLLTNQNI
jgi:putative ABC transport system permease protein